MAMKNLRNSLRAQLAFIQELLRQARQIGIERQVELGYQLMDDDSIVTGVDKEIETFMIERISEVYAEHRIITGERDAIKGTGNYSWAIDPIDGTRVYCGGLPFWGISVG